jgi:hypothetical protein
MIRILPNTINKESLTTKLTLIIVGLTAGSALLVPATYASFHPVTTGEIADDTIHSVDIRNGQVGSADIGQGQVRTGDIANDAIRAPISRIFGEEVTLSVNEVSTAHATCPGGSVLTGGGFNAGGIITITGSFAEDASTWTVRGINTGPTAHQMQAFAMCIAPMP